MTRHEIKEAMTAIANAYTGPAARIVQRHEPECRTRLSSIIRHECTCVNPDFYMEARGRYFMEAPRGSDRSFK